MITHDDETMSRAPQVGALIHETIGLLVSQTMAPTIPEIMQAAKDCVDRFPQIEGRTHKQNIASGVSAYFNRLLPPPAWLFHGCEVHVDHGRLDLVWIDFQDRVIVDEIKATDARHLRLTRTRKQVDHYRACAVDTWGDAFVGLRLMSIRDPHSSLLISPDGTTTDLFASEFVRGA